MNELSMNNIDHTFGRQRETTELVNSNHLAMINSPDFVALRKSSRSIEREREKVVHDSLT
jgi:hypothetical protein